MHRSLRYEPRRSSVRRMKRLPLRLWFLGIAGCAGSTGSGETHPAPVPNGAVTGTAAAAPHDSAPAFAMPSAPLPPGLDLSAMDPKANPCEDFYRFSCGGWMDSTEIPNDRPSTSRGFVMIHDRNELILKDILERAAAKKLSKNDANAQKLGDYWATCIDDGGRTTALTEVKKALAGFKGIAGGKKLAEAVGKLHANAVRPLFNFASSPDLKDASHVVAHLSEGGLGLPDRDYYVVDTPDKLKVRDLYKAHVAKMFELLGDKPEDAAKKSAVVLELETRLAKVTQTKVEQRDPEKQHHRLDLAGLKKDFGAFDWSAYLSAAGFPKLTEINVTHPEFVAELAKIAGESAAERNEIYLSWVYLREVAQTLPKSFEEQDFAFRSQALTGAKEDRLRWKKCVGWADAQLGEILGQVFVSEQFGADSKERTLSMVKSLEESFEANLASLSWMDEGTKAVAKKKISAMLNKIGYPDKWRDYSSYKTDRKSFLGNYLRGTAFEVRRDLEKVGKPVDKSEWLMTPPTVNAYNDPQTNQIVFPAGILQPPFFNREAPDAVNFGAMGMVVGHEITHGFDDEGRKFDADGNLKDWWSEAAGKQFESRTQCVKEQFDGYVAVDDLHVKGDLTLGENVADLGGLKLSLQAMKAWEAKHPAPYQGWTSSQLFFLGYGQSWCTKRRPEDSRVRVNVDPHSPPIWRVNGPLSNLKAFSEAFGCKAGQKMARPNACEVW
ncbi:MAG: M13 family metallopeptidase [Myxococcota bacterium]